MNILHTIYLVIHIIGTAIIVGTAFIALIAMQKRFVSRQVSQLLVLAWQIAMLVIVIQLITGILMGFGYWADILRDPYFITKMMLLLAGGAVAGIISGKLRRLDSKDTAALKQLRAWSLLAFLLFTAVATLGIAMVQAHTS